MGAILILFFVIVAFIAIMACSIKYEFYYLDKYCDKFGLFTGLSFIIALGTGISAFWFSLHYESPTTDKYKISLALTVFFIILTIVRIIIEWLKPNITLQDKLLFAILQVLLPLAFFGILFVVVVLIMLIFGGGASKRKK